LLNRGVGLTRGHTRRPRVAEPPASIKSCRCAGRESFVPLIPRCRQTFGTTIPSDFGLNSSSRPSACEYLGFLILTQYGDGLSVGRWAALLRFAGGNVFLDSPFHRTRRDLSRAIPPFARSRGYFREADAREGPLGKRLVRRRSQQRSLLPK
jgi:hypothetical protein